MYASTREPELATVVDWDAAQKAAFVQMQFDAQHAYYQEHYEGAAFDVILVGGQPAGRLYLHRRDDEIRIMDIALLPEYCNRGIGTTLLRGLQSEAAAGKPLRIHVERFNPALRLYERLGFWQIDDRGVYLFMEWRDDNSQRSNDPREAVRPNWMRVTVWLERTTFTRHDSTHRTLFPAGVRHR